MNLQQAVLLSTTGGGRRPALVQRPPLVFPAAPHPYRDVLPWDPPLTRDFLRADSWAISIPDAPWIPGASSEHPERILSWFLDRYSIPLQMRYLEETASYGYTHVRLSWGDSKGPRDNGPLSPPGAEQTQDQFIETCLRVKSVISPRDDKPLSPRVYIASKYFDPRDMTLAQYQDRFGRFMEALWRHRACDEVAPGWEWNAFNHPDHTIPIFKWVGSEAHKHGVTCWFHGLPHFVWWGPDGSDRFQFWDALGDDVDGVDFQGEPYWSMDELQARMIDSLWAFGQAGNKHKFRMDEDIAMWQFTGRPTSTGEPADEAQGRARGYLACCTVDTVRNTDAKCWGYGNGGSMPDGSPL